MTSSRSQQLNLSAIGAATNPAPLAGTDINRGQNLSTSEINSETRLFGIYYWFITSAGDE
jgi:hypothetical protein